MFPVYRKDELQSQEWNIAMNLTEHTDGSVTGACTNSGYGNLTGYVVRSESTRLLVLSGATSRARTVNPTG